MPDLNGETGELRFTIEVTRKGTGEVETFEMVGKIVSDEVEEAE